MIVHSGKNLPKMQMFGGADPFLAISTLGASGQKVLVLKTETIKGSLNPHWKEQQVTGSEVHSSP